MARVRLTGSEREPVPSSRRTGPVDPAEPVTVTVFVRRGGEPVAGVEPSAAIERADARRARRMLGETTGAAPADLDRVVAFAASSYLAVEGVDVGRRTVRLSGAAADMSRAFGVHLARYEVGTGEEATSYRGREGYVHLPPDLADIVVAVLGLDDRPQAGCSVRIGRTLGPGRGRAGMRAPAGAATAVGPCSRPSGMPGRAGTRP